LQPFLAHPGHLGAIFGTLCPRFHSAAPRAALRAAPPRQELGLPFDTRGTEQFFAAVRAPALVPASAELLLDLAARGLVSPVPPRTLHAPARRAAAAPAAAAAVASGDNSGAGGGAGGGAVVGAAAGARRDWGGASAAVDAARARTVAALERRREAALLAGRAALEEQRRVAEKRAAAQGAVADAAAELLAATRAQSRPVLAQVRRNVALAASALDA
jgi:hypothetical protein